MKQASLQRTAFLLIIVGAGLVVVMANRQHHAAMPHDGRLHPFPMTEVMHSPLVPPGPQVSILFRWQDADGAGLEESLEQLLPDRGANLSLRRTLGSGTTAFSSTIHLTPHVYPNETVRLQMSGDAHFPDGSVMAITCDKTVRDRAPVTVATVPERPASATGRTLHAPNGPPLHTLTLTPTINNDDQPSRPGHARLGNF